MAFKLVGSLPGPGWSWWSWLVQRTALLSQKCVPFEWNNLVLKKITNYGMSLAVITGSRLQKGYLRPYLILIHCIDKLFSFQLQRKGGMEIDGHQLLYDLVSGCHNSNLWDQQKICSRSVQAAVFQGCKPFVSLAPDWQIFSYWLIDWLIDVMNK